MNQSYKLKYICSFYHDLLVLENWQATLFHLDLDKKLTYSCQIWEMNNGTFSTDIQVSNLTPSQKINQEVSQEIFQSLTRRVINENFSEFIRTDRLIKSKTMMGDQYLNVNH